MVKSQNFSELDMPLHNTWDVTDHQSGQLLSMHCAYMHAAQLKCFLDCTSYTQPRLGAK